LYREKGYIPHGAVDESEVWGAVSTTQEYNLADFCLARMASEMGKEDDAELFSERSLGYRYFFDESTGFLRPRLQDGSWFEPFDPLKSHWPGGPGYVEGNAWHYNFFVPHDIAGLIDLYGSEQSFVDRLQRCFDEGYFTMGNEPDIAYPFLFNYVDGEEWRSQRAVRQIVGELYTTEPSGIPGNDDCGTMSAWLVFAMMGLYPDCPGKPNYQIVVPSFNEIEIELDPDFYLGESLVVKTLGEPSSDRYIDSIRFSGQKLTGYAIDHDKLVSGGSLVISLEK